MLRLKKNIPFELFIKKRWIKVINVREIWKVTDGWWMPADQFVDRVYFKLILENMMLIVIYKDIKDGTWYSYIR